MKNFILILKALAIAAAFCLFGEARAEFEKVPVPRDGFKAEYSQAKTGILPTTTSG